MSVCDDYEFWGPGYEECRAFKEQEIYPCKMDFIGKRCDDGLPDTCPYAPILKIMAEAEEVSHFSIDEKLDEIEGGGWEVVEFWIRRCRDDSKPRH